jgi:hypothetical protein
MSAAALVVVLLASTPTTLQLTPPSPQLVLDGVGAAWPAAPTSAPVLRESTREWLKVFGWLALAIGAVSGATAVAYLTTGQHLYGNTVPELYAIGAVGGALLITGTVMLSVAFRF